MAAVNRGNGIMQGMDRYTRTEKLGEGAYGVVYKGIDNVTGAAVAMKKVKIESEDEGVPSTTIREISLLQALTKVPHLNIVQLHAVIHEQQRLYLVFEFLDGDLKQYMDKTAGPLSPLLVKSYMRQLLLGLQHMHEHRVLHRDLKPQNLLIDRNGNLKIADLGLARSFGLPIAALTHEIVTLWYRAPEVLLGCKLYSPAVDIWSVACIMIELITKHPLLPGDSEIDQLFKTFRLLGTPNDSLWPSVSSLPDYKSTFPQWQPRPLADSVVALAADPVAVDLLSRMLVYDPVRRISAAAALQHPYFDGIEAQMAIAAQLREENEVENQRQQQQQQHGSSGNSYDAGKKQQPVQQQQQGAVRVPLGMKN